VSYSVCSLAAAPLHGALYIRRVQLGADLIRVRVRVRVRVRG